VLRTGYIELVATDPQWQGHGFASALLRAAVADLAAFELGALSPSDDAFYSRLGWERWRGPLSVRLGSTAEPTPDEEIMVLRTPRTPPWLTLDMPLSCEWREGEVW
jgi:predicted N-acetyltransferase YhbS